MCLFLKRKKHDSRTYYRQFGSTISYYCEWQQAVFSAGEYCLGTVPTIVRGGSILAINHKKNINLKFLRINK